MSVMVDRYPSPDEKLRARRIVESGGGPVPTALATISRFGGRTAIASVVGSDAVGRFILDGLKDEDIDCSAVSAVADFESPTSIIVIENGRRTIFEAPGGIDFPLTWESVRRLPLDSARTLLVDARVVPVQRLAAEAVRAAGGLVVLDCGHPRDGVDALVEVTDIAIFSHTYPVSLHGESCDLRSFLESVVDRLPEDGPAIAGVTKGAMGSLLHDRDGRWVEHEAPRVDAVDTTGAGDVFHGAFVHAYLKTGSMERASRFANVTAARKCEGLTGRAPLPEEATIWKECGAGD